jgi:predicted phosphodiesterase
MLIRIISDLHLEFGNFELPPLPEDKETILILAGDVGLSDRLYTFEPFKNVFENFRKVIYILGNHEFYKDSFKKSLKTIKTFLSPYENVEVINNEIITIDDVSFICSTMWTSFNNANPIDMQLAKTSMNDYIVIRTGPDKAPYLKKLDPIDTFNEYVKAVEFIFPSIVEQKKKMRKVVVVTHHLPSYLSVEEQFKGERLNSAYATELFNEIEETKPDYWIHGHTHASFDYMIGNTHVICNPRGYYSKALNKNFDPLLRIQI